MSRDREDDEYLKKLREEANEFIGNLNTLTEVMSYMHFLFDCTNDEVIKVLEKLETWENQAEKHIALSLIIPIVQMAGSLLVFTAHPINFPHFLKFSNNPLVIQLHETAKKLAMLTNNTSLIEQLPPEVREVFLRTPIDSEFKKHEGD